MRGQLKPSLVASGMTRHGNTFWSTTNNRSAPKPWPSRQPRPSRSSRRRALRLRLWSFAGRVAPRGRIRGGVGFRPHLARARAVDARGLACDPGCEPGLLPGIVGAGGTNRPAARRLDRSAAGGPDRLPGSRDLAGARARLVCGIVRPVGRTDRPGRAGGSQSGGSVRSW